MWTMTVIDKIICQCSCNEKLIRGKKQHAAVQQFLTFQLVRLTWGNRSTLTIKEIIDQLIFYHFSKKSHFSCLVK